jgi:hypothetical protein
MRTNKNKSTRPWNARLNNSGSIQDREIYYYFSHSVGIGSEAHSASSPMAHSPGIKRPGREADWSILRMC